MANRFWVLGTGTWDASDTTHWSTTSGGSGGASVPGTGDAAVFDANSGGGTVTVNTDFTIQSLTMGAFTGTLDFATNNNSPTFNVSTTNVSLTGTGTRTLNMGSGTWTLAGNNSTIWDCTTATNLTLNAGTSTIVCGATASQAQRTFAGGGKTYGTLTINGAATFANNAPFSITGSNTFATVNITSPIWIRLPGGGTTTITNAISWAGSSSSNAIMLDGGTGATSTISSANNGSLSWAVLTGVAFSGGGTFTATNSFDMKANSGITITGPSGTATARVIGG